jgi:hypothetical protein
MVLFIRALFICHILGISVFRGIPQSGQRFIKNLQTFWITQERGDAHGWRRLRVELGSDFPAYAR